MDLPMHGDATLLKEKIIKTDALLKKYQENLSKLKKATELCKYLKKKFEETKQTLEITQLENERTKFKLENVQSKYQELEVENKRSSSEFSKLQEQYQKYTLDSQSTIKNLQDELRMLQELKQSSSDADKIKSLKDKLKKLQVAEKNYKVEIDKLNVQQNNICEKHEAEKSTLYKQIEKLKSQVIPNQEECHLKPVSLNDNIDLKNQLNGGIPTNTDSNHIQDKSEIHSGELNLSLSKALNDLKLANSENVTLKQQLNMKNREIAAFLIKKAGKSVSVQTEKIVNNLKDTCHQICNDYLPDLSSESDLEDTVHEDSHVSAPRVNENNIALPDLTRIMEEKSQEIVSNVPSHCNGLYETPNKLAVSTQTECLDTGESVALNDLELANTENTKLKQQLNMKNREIAALQIKKSVESVYVQTQQIIDNNERLCYTESLRDYFPDSSSESDSEDVDDVKQQPPGIDLEEKQNQNNIHIFGGTNSINEKMDNFKGLSEMKNLSPSESAICDMSTQTEQLYTGVCTRKPGMAVISTQTTIKTISFSTQTEHKYVSLSTQTDRDDSLTKGINISIQNDPTASDEESISDILTEMKNIPRLLSPISDILDEKIPNAKQTISKKNINFAKTKLKWRTIYANRSYSPKYLPWKRRMTVKNLRSNIVQDSVARALRILKRAKINFTISNESILPQEILTHSRYYCSPQDISQNHPVGPKKNFAEKLSCCCSSCTANFTHMMLSDRGDCTELLGFFNEERESTTRTKVNIASHTIKCNDNREPKADIVDETAKIVISKLKKEFNFIPKKRRRRNLSSSDSEISEFEKGGVSNERLIKKTKRFQGMKHRRYRQTEETTSGFESSSTPLTQYSTINSLNSGIKFSENQLQTALEDFSSNMQNIKTPLSPLSDISILNQISASNVSSANESLGDCESQTINKYSVHSDSHMNEEVIDCNMKKVSYDGIPEINKQKSDFKLSQNKYEGDEINSNDTGTSIEKIKPRKKKQPMGKLKSKTLRQFKEKRLMFQTEHPRVVSVCNGTIKNNANNESTAQNKCISEATNDKTAERKSPNGKNDGTMETQFVMQCMKVDLLEENSGGKCDVDVLFQKSKKTFDPSYSKSSRKTNAESKGKHTNPDDVKDIYPIINSKEFTGATQVIQKSGDVKDLQIPSRKFESKNQTTTVDSFKLDSIKDTSVMQSDKRTMWQTESTEAKDDISSSYVLSDKNVSTSNTKNCSLMANSHFTRSRSKASLICDEKLKNGTNGDLLQDLLIPAPVKEYVEPQSKLLKAIDNHKNEKSSDMSYTSDKSVNGGIHPDTDFSLKDSDAKATNMTPESGRRRSRRLVIKSEISNSNDKSGITVQSDSRESLTVTENSTETSVEHCGTNSPEKNELIPNVDMNHELNITNDKIVSAVESIEPDLPQVSLCDILDTPASPEYLPEPEDCDMKIIPLDPIEIIGNPEFCMKEKNVNEEIQQEEKSSVNKMAHQEKFRAEKRSRKSSVNKKGTKKKIVVLQNIVVHPRNITSVSENEDVDKFGPCDILDKILDDMDKNRKLSIPTKHSVSSIGNKNHTVSNAATTNHKLDDKEWRRMILDVAERIHCDEGMLNYDLQPFGIQIMPQTYLKKHSLLEKANILIKKLKIANESENIRDQLILEFKRFPPETVVNIILYGLIKDTEHTLWKYHPLLLLTKLQWQFLKLMIQLEQGKMRNIFELYLQTAESLLYRKCSLTKVVPVTRLYVAICKLHGNVNRVRKLCCEAFYYTADLAVVLLYTVLTSWIEIFPKQDNEKCFPIAEVMAQLIHLKNIKNRNYKLQPLKALLNQYYGYPEERLNCDEFFEGLVQKYLRNPVRMLNFAIRLYCKYKNNDWLKKKINEIFKPLVYKIPVENEEFKATVIILLANICQHLKISSTDKYMVELKAWFSSLSEGDAPEVIQHSVEYALNILSVTRTRQKKGKKAKAKKNLELSQQNGNG